MIQLREFRESDWPSVWPILHATVLAGDVYAFSPQTTEEEMHEIWIGVPTETFVACDPDGDVLGSYYIKPNQPGRGSHVCNCGYVVDVRARGKGIASSMCEHSQARAIALGFTAMQFNFVVSSNEDAIHLWKKHGFAVVGRLPGAFRHARLGYVDVFVMFKRLVS